MADALAANNRAATTVLVAGPGLADTGTILFVGIMDSIAAWR
jgi:phage tail protein X